MHRDGSATQSRPRTLIVMCRLLFEGLEIVHMHVGKETDLHGIQKAVNTTDYATWHNRALRKLFPCWVSVSAVAGYSGVTGQLAAVTDN